MASISTPVRAVSEASAVRVTVPAAGSSSAATSTWSRPGGWQSGMSSAVRLAAWMPARRAVPRTSPLGASPAATTAAVAGLMRTTARATARRVVAGLAPTSTIEARPSASRWVRPPSGTASGRRDGGAVAALGLGDDRSHAPGVARAQQRDRVLVAGDDLLEERLAVLVGRERPLRPPANVVEHDGERRVLLAEELGDLALHALGQRGGCAGRRDRD